MHILELLQPGKTAISFELFPPRTAESAAKLQATVRELESFAPDFVSVTYGAGGSTRALTRDLVLQLKRDTSLNPVPHLTCVAQQERDISAILESYASAGIQNLLALRGDPPAGLGVHDHGKDDFPFATDLVRYIRQFNERGNHPDKHGFGIGVAGFPEGHPGTPNRLKELEHLKAKVDAGADYICTQLFFDNHDFHDYRERCELAGIHVPIIAGILPVTSLAGLRRMAELAGGARFPARLLKRLQQAGDEPESVRRAGIEYATEQCADLLAHQVAGIHFYTLNQSEAVKEILSALDDTRIHR